MAEDYYLNDDPKIGVGALVRWYVYVYNHMGSPQSVSIRVKVLNSTEEDPKDLTPSPRTRSIVVSRYAKIGMGLGTVCALEKMVQQNCYRQAKGGAL